MESDKHQPQPRNPQVDFFRGIVLMIIFINHMPLNEWFYYTPSRFGLSDAAETFVYLSGFAAALAYGRGFEQSGIGWGTLRILHRCTRIYWANLCLFFVLAAICVVGNRWMTGTDYIQRLSLEYFFEHTQDALFGIVMLRYIPMYLDILPMYLVVMLWIPIVWMLARQHLALALGMSVLVYLAANHFGWNLPADPLSNRVWFFNPFAWQFLFFTGFAFGAGWFRNPRPNWLLITLALLFVVFSIPLGHEPTFRRFPWILEWRISHGYLVDKTNLGILRWVHFLALAYLMNKLFNWKEHWLKMALPRWIATMGRQSLPIFLFGTCLSYLGGILLDLTGRDAFNIAWVNLSGLGLMIACAKGLVWLNSKPWNSVNTGASPGRVTTGVFVKQAVLMSILVSMAVSPFLLLHSYRRDGVDAPTVTASQSNGEEGLQSSQDVPQPALEDRIEWQDGLNRI